MIDRLPPHTIVAENADLLYYKDGIVVAQLMKMTKGMWEIK